MATYYVESTIKFSGYVEADSAKEAEEIGWYYDNLEYECVDDISVELQDEEEDEDED